MRVIKLLRETWGNLLTLLLPILISIDVIRDILNNYYLLWAVAIILFVIGYYQTIKHFKSRDSFIEDIGELENARTILNTNLESIPFSMIKELSKFLELGNRDRITLYRVKENQSFVPVARFSESPIYRNYGRRQYPINKGFIGQCWREGEVKKEGLPSYDRSPENYVNATRDQTNMAEEEIKNLEMKSSSYYCKRLDHNGDDPMAIVVIESTKTRFSINIEEIKLFLEGPFGKTLINTVKMNSPIGRED